MTTEPPPGSGQQPPDDDPFKKHPPPGGPETPGPGSPYDTPGGAPPPPQGGDPYGGGGGPYGGGGGPYGGAPGSADPLAGMPPLADSARRTLARIIDMILVGIVVWLLTWPFGVSEYNVNGDNVNVGNSFGQSAVAAVLFIAYDTVLISRTGQTLGKKWLRMRVANLDNGATPSVQTSLARAAVLWLPFAFCCACLWTAIAGGWSFFDRPYKQGLHDKAAKTVVVSTG
ncbi:RDD family protein [Streptomyces fungicidicus]|uniref:RDD family protein n=1 Tax=Streptomyces fungicidicus TaxID=68203 RepID=A0A494V2C1_9ACTN|nr:MULTISPECIES: RDD family protein [Streptomyces]AYL36318.1 RDD family protein [Streptomyces fungicidicus]QKW00745.1 RDD family protein [Streptomyces sp. NA02536]TQL22261.1 putative RDD family membrane protein YckC [Streptomyces sp. SLBN-134]